MTMMISMEMAVMELVVAEVEGVVINGAEAGPDGKDCPPPRRRNDVGEGLAFAATRP